MKTVYILGAGFSKVAGIPIQAELATQLIDPSFDSRLDKVITQAITEYLSDIFGFNGGALPTLEDMFTVIDLSTSSGHNLSRKYTPKRLRALRRMLKYRIFSILEKPFSPIPSIEKLLVPVQDNPSDTAFVVLNWDIVLEKHLLTINKNLNIDYGFPCFDWNNPTSRYDHTRSAIAVNKIHGSINWVYCDNCKSLFYDLDQNLHLKTKAGLYREDFILYNKAFSEQYFEKEMECDPQDRQCKFCGEIISSHIATFSFRKSFRTHAYPAIWQKSERLLSEAERWVFIGYSLPDADYEFKHMLKTAQHRLVRPNRQIEAIIKSNDSITQRFHTFFGSSNVSVFDAGLENYTT